jgi:lipopolysaccharide export system permease protein
MLNLIDRYVLSEIAKVFGAIMVTLLLVTVSMLFLRTLEQVNIGALNSEAVLRFLGFQVLRDTASLLPPAFFIAALVTLGRLARDSELIALGACGVGPWRLYKSLLLFALPLSLMTGWFSLVLQPYASLQIQRIEEAQNERATQVSGLQAGRFYQRQEGRITFYAAGLGDDRRFRDVFIQDRGEDPPRLVLSRRGAFVQRTDDGRQAVVLDEGRRFDGTPGAADYGIADFARYTFFLDPEAETGADRRRRSSMPTPALIGSDNLRDRAELGHRLAGPAGIFALALMAIPLTTLSPRQRGTGRLMLAFLAYFAFFNLQRLAESWLESGVTPPWLGVLWYQAVIVFAVYAALVPGSFWWRRLLRRCQPARAATDPA